MPTRDVIGSLVDLAEQILKPVGNDWALYLHIAGELKLAIAMARAEQVERAKPIDCDWLLSIGFALIPYDPIYLWHQQTGMSWRGVLTMSTSTAGYRHIPNATRGDVLDILRILSDSRVGPVT